MQPFQGRHPQSGTHAQAPYSQTTQGRRPNAPTQTAASRGPSQNPQQQVLASNHSPRPYPARETLRKNDNFTNTSGSSLTNTIDRFSDSVGGQQALRRLLLAVGAFFLLFTILSATKFINDGRQYNENTKKTFSQSLVNKAQDVSRRIDTEIAWIDRALFTDGTPRQITNFIAQSNEIMGVAFVDANGTVMAQAGELGATISKIDSRNFPKGDVQVSSIVSSEGRAQPVIIRRKGDVFLLTALRPQSFIGQNSENAALIMDGGRVIDGGLNVNGADALSIYNIDAQSLATLTKSTDPSSISSFELNGEKVWIGAARVPKSFLSITDTEERALTSTLKQNIMLFGLLVLGMAWLIWMLVSQMLKQLNTLKAQQIDDQVSRQRYEAAVDGSKGGVWEIDMGRNTAYLSPSLAKVFNLPEEHTTLQMSHFLGLFASSDRDRLFSAIRRSHISGDFDIELGLAQLPIYMACRGRPSVRGSDNAKIIIGMALDITEMRGAQARLQAAEARLFDALSSMSDSFVIWDQMDRLVLWNQRFESFFGFQPGQLQVGTEYATVQYHGSQAIASITEHAEGDEIELNDGRWIRYTETHTADGGRVSIGTEVTAIRSREHELEVNQDALEKTINVLRESQVRIVELAENYEQEKIRAEEASQSKSEFLANMSHELRTPLNAINGFSDIMKKELFGPLGDARYKEYVSDILFSGQHLLSLINDILDMSKIEAGKMTLNTETLQINDMIAQVVRIVRGRAEENRLKLVFEELPANEIEADPRAVKQVLLNLMTNAIKFTPEGGSVTVAVESKSAGLIVRVTDTGIGISKEDIERLAQPFEQIDSQHSRKHEGTGLGLALSKSLVELHGGNFTMESEVGQGTTVIFTLTSKPPAVKEKAPDREVGTEITRLAQDIADVLTVGEASMEQKKAQTSLPAAASIPQTTATPPPPIMTPQVPSPQAPIQPPPVPQSGPEEFVPQEFVPQAYSPTQMYTQQGQGTPPPPPQVNQPSAPRPVAPPQPYKSNSAA